MAAAATAAGGRRERDGQIAVDHVAGADFGAGRVAVPPFSTDSMAVGGCGLAGLTHAAAGHARRPRAMAGLQGLVV